MKAVLCPVCNGSGRVWGGFESGTVPEAHCHGCAEWGSKGWVVVPDEHTIMIDYPDGANDTISCDPTNWDAYTYDPHYYRDYDGTIVYDKPIFTY